MEAEPPRFLALLPPVPFPPTLPTLKAAYGETIAQVLQEVVQHSAEHARAAILEVAVACPHLVEARRLPRASLYNQTQSLVAGIYKLVCIIAARENINVEDQDGVDVRLLLVAWSPHKHEVSPIPYNIVVDLESLARSERGWQYAFGVESESGEAFMKAFVEAKRGIEGGQQTQDGTGTEALDASAGDQPAADSTSRRHYDVAVGGTFDHLHIGHKLLLTMTIFAVDDRHRNENSSATIGITGDQLLVNKKHSGLVECWTDRQKAVALFVDAILNFSLSNTEEQQHESRLRDDPGPNGKGVDVHYPSGLVVKYTEIQDPFGPTITEEGISALIISGETRSGGKAVNDKRRERSWSELDVFEVDVLDAEEEASIMEGFESKLSSTAIREKLARKSESKM